MSSSTYLSIRRHHPYEIRNHLCKPPKKPIRKIIIGNLEEKITEIDLKIYFGIFGKIANLCIKEIRLISSRKFALITYKLPEEASMVLKIKDHKLKGVKLQVTAAANCNQPSLSETIKSPSIDTTISISNSNLLNLSLLSLNDYCLLHVFSFLNLAEQVKVSRLCSRLNAIGQVLFSKVKRVVLDDIGCDTLLEASNTLQNINKQVKHFVARPRLGRRRLFYQYTAIFLTPQYFNLKILEFGNIKLKRSTYKSLMPIFRNLEFLTLVNCWLTDNIFILLKTCLKLKILDISQNYKIKGDRLSTLPDTIIKLNLTQCIHISPHNFIELCEVAKFKNVSLNGCFQLFNVIEHLIHVKSLEGIEMLNWGPLCDCGDNFFNILLRKKSDTLQKLCMPGFKFNDFQKISFRNFSNLKHLCLSKVDEQLLNLLPNCLTYFAMVDSNYVSVDALIKFVERTPNIQTICVPYCKQFSCMLVFKLLKKLQLLNRPFCLKLHVSGTKIRSSVKEEPLYRELKHLLELSFYMIDH